MDASCSCAAGCPLLSPAHPCLQPAPKAPPPTPTPTPTAPAPDPRPQEHTFQPYEDLLPYEAFSIRLTNSDLPRIREILRGVTEEQYAGMLRELIRYRDAFHWYADEGGRAFDWTIASLRRRWQNLKALYY